MTSELRQPLTPEQRRELIGLGALLAKIVDFGGKLLASQPEDRVLTLGEAAALFSFRHMMEVTDEGDQGSVFAYGITYFRLLTAR